MRPRGDARQRMFQAAADLHQAMGRVSACAMAARVGLPVDKAREVARDMERSGELERCGRVRLPHARKPVLLYVPRHLKEAQALRLADITHSWASARLDN